MKSLFGEYFGYFFVVIWLLIVTLFFLSERRRWKDEKVSQRIRQQIVVFGTWLHNWFRY